MTYFPGISFKKKKNIVSTLIFSHCGSLIENSAFVFEVNQEK